MLELVDSVEKGSDRAITMQECYLMKALCDIYVVTKATEFTQGLIEEKQKSSNSKNFKKPCRQERGADVI